MEKTRKRIVINPSLGMSVAKRLTILRRARAVWSKRKTDPIKELKKIRREWS